MSKFCQERFSQKGSHQMHIMAICLMSVKFAKPDLHRKAISITIQKDWGYVPIEIAFLWRYVLAKFTLMRLLFEVNCYCDSLSVKICFVCQRLFLRKKNRRQCVESENSDCRVKAICRYYSTYMCIFVPGGTFSKKETAKPEVIIKA